MSLLNKEKVLILERFSTKNDSGLNLPNSIIYVLIICGVFQDCNINLIGAILDMLKPNMGILINRVFDALIPPNKFSSAFENFSQFPEFLLTCFGIFIQKFIDVNIKTYGN